MKIRNVLNELTAEAGIGNESKPVIRYFLGGSPKPLKFEELPPESKKNATMLANKHGALLKKLGSGKFDTSNGFDITFMADGKAKIKSPSTGVEEIVRIN